MSLFINLTIFIFTLFIGLLTYFKWKYSYWRKKNVPYIEPSIPFGTTENPYTRKCHVAILAQQQYQYLKSLGHKFGGLYLIIRPSLLAVDVELIRHIMSKDFQHFMDRGTYYNEKDDPLSANLFHLEGHRWRHLRSKLTPTFTSGKMKMMFPTLIACGDPLVTAVHEHALKKEPVDIKDILARFTTDVIGSCAFGLDCNSFNEPESEFRKFGKIILSVDSKLAVIKMMIAFASPELGRFLGITMVPPEPKQFFLDVIKKTVSYRTTNNIVRNDFIQILMNIEAEDGSGEGLTIEQMTAEAIIFWFAGFETSSTTMTFCLYELAVNQDIQNKVRSEINAVLTKHDNNLTYDAVMEMKYLSQVIDETLRKYPPGATLPRICVQDYQIPGTDIIIEKGTRIVIPIYALHHDPEHFPNPERFEPERFADDNRGNIHPFTYMPFGEGPRICIGLRFGLLQTKVGLAILLKNFKFLLDSKTCSPLQFNRFGLVLSAQGGIWLNIEKIGEPIT